MILILETKIELEQLRTLCQQYYVTFVKFVADLGNRRIAIGGELHADAVTILLEQGASQDDLWGANFYPRELPAKRIEYTALINIRPRQNNPGMEIIHQDIRDRVRELAESLIMAPEEILN